jgi:hypothetical protein
MSFQGQLAASDVFAEATTALESACQSIRESLTRLERLYCLDTDLAQFLRARHQLFSGIFLYGQLLHVDLCRIFKTVYEVTEVCQVSEPFRGF